MLAYHSTLPVVAVCFPTAAADRLDMITGVSPDVMAMDAVHHDVIVLGDSNTKFSQSDSILCTRHAEPSTLVGAWKSFANKSSLQEVRGSSDASAPLPTCVQHRSLSCIDHILVSRSLFRWIQGTELAQEVPSDHNGLILCVALSRADSLQGVRDAMDRQRRRAVPAFVFKVEPYASYLRDGIRRWARRTPADADAVIDWWESLKLQVCHLAMKLVPIHRAKFMRALRQQQRALASALEQARTSGTTMHWDAYIIQARQKFHMVQQRYVDQASWHNSYTWIHMGERPSKRMSADILRGKPSCSSCDLGSAGP